MICLCASERNGLLPPFRRESSACRCADAIAKAGYLFFFFSLFFESMPLLMLISDVVDALTGDAQ